MKRLLQLCMAACLILTLALPATAADAGKNRKWFSFVMLQMMGREPNPQEVAMWKDKYTSGKFKEEVYNWMTQSKEFNERLARFYYKNLLGREPSKEAREFWGKRMKDKGTANVIMGIVVDKEYMNKKAKTPELYASNLLQDLLGLKPSEEQIKVWAAKTDLKKPGVVVEQALATDEYKSHQVKLFYTWLLGREPDKSEVRSWHDLWKNKGKNEDWVLRQFAYGEEFQKAAEK